MSEPIPNRLVFVWLGPDFPVANVIAVASAMSKCDPEEVVLIADRLTRSHPDLAQFGERLKIVTPRDVLDADPVPGMGSQLGSLYEALDHAAARANLLRLVELWRRGGIYLDTDTITVRDLGPLRRHRGFCGREVLAFPRDLIVSRRPGRWAAAGLRYAVRAACARARRPDRAFRVFEGVYPQAVNNAVLGACPGNDTIGRALERVALIEPAERLRRFRLGTHLLQEVTRNRSGVHMQVLGPRAFYPLGPEISVAWFRPGSAARCDELIGPETYVVHWYASVQQRLEHDIDAGWIERSREDVAFARLASPYLAA